MPKRKTKKDQKEVTGGIDGYPAFYGKILQHMETASLVEPMQSTQFQDPDISELMSAYRWMPVQHYPKKLVPETKKNSVELNRVSETQLVLAVRAGGNIPAGQRLAQKNTLHEVTLILDGRINFNTSYVYTGTAGWQYIVVDVPLLKTFSADVGFEVEKDGKLLGGGILKVNDEMSQATKMSLVRYTSLGVVEGWASASLPSEDDVFLVVKIQDETFIHKTDCQWEKEPLRKFNFSVNAPLEELCRIEIEGLDGSKGRRSPIWVFRNAGRGFILTNPMLKEGKVNITIVSSDRKEHFPAKLRDIVSGKIFPIDQEDAIDFKYFEGYNTVGLPKSVLKNDVRYLVLSKDGQNLGALPSLAPLWGELKD